MSNGTRVNQKSCRDCGYWLEPNARGCPRCAMNVEAEAMIEHFVWRRLLPGLAALSVIIVAGLVWWFR